MSTRANVARDEAIASGPPGGPSRLPDHNGRLAVFDLDRTLLPGSSLSLFGRALARTARPGARWLLDRHLAAGDFCVIASASPQPLVDAAARALGAQRAVGTRAEVCDG
jgi:phosphoserine phosphatase